MIKDNALEERLNAIMKGEIPPPPEIPYEIKQFEEEIDDIYEIISQKDNGWSILKNIWKSIDVVITSILFGYAFSVIFDLEWEFFQIAGIGFVFNYIISVLPRRILNFLQNR